jgi:hypothetical protein
LDKDIKPLITIMYDITKIPKLNVIGRTSSVSRGLLLVNRALIVTNKKRIPEINPAFTDFIFFGDIFGFIL